MLCLCLQWINNLWLSEILRCWIKKCLGRWLHNFFHSMLYLLLQNNMVFIDHIMGIAPRNWHIIHDIISSMNKFINTKNSIYHVGWTQHYMVELVSTSSCGSSFKKCENIIVYALKFKLKDNTNLESTYITLRDK